MKKIYLFLLMVTSLLISTNLNAAVIEVGTIADLQTAINSANNGDEIRLTADIDYSYTSDYYLNITKSITIDGQGHTLTGACKRANADFWATLYVNEKAEDVAMMDIVIKDITLVNNKKTSSYGASIRFQHNINTVTLTNVVMDITGGVRANSAPLFLGGSDTNNPTYTLNNCQLLGKNNDYPYYSWIKAHVIANNSSFSGYCGMYFKEGSYGTVVDATKCFFDAPNVHSGISNAFGVFAFEDANITLNLTSCGMNAEQIGDQSQRLLDVKYSIPVANRDQFVAKVTIDGDDSFFNASWSENFTDPVLNQIIFTPAGQPFIPEGENEMPVVSMVFKGGTYSFDPTSIGWYDSWVIDDEGKMTGNVNIRFAEIPDGYEVKEINTIQDGVETTLYRVRKAITTAYSINADVEGEGEGQNENTEFIISANESVEQESTVANYVEVGSDATLTVGEGKTLEVTNGLDVAAGSQVVVEPGATLVVGEGGVITGDAEGIVIETEDTKPASFLLNPDVIVNTTPNLTVKMIANAGKDGEDWYWHRFAMPVNGITSWTKQNAEGTEITVPTYLQGWDYIENEWADRTVDQMVPFLGYTLTYDEVNGTPTTGETEVTYIFKGNLVGNLNKDLLFQAKGYNFFGNSYTAYIDAKTLLADVMNDPTIGGAVYMWDANNQVYEAVTMRDLRDHADRLDDFMKEIAPMQTFILQLRSSDIPTVSVDYRSTIWGNPRYNKVAATAPARQMASNDNYVKITLTAENGKTDAVRLTENAEFSAAYDNGADADKYMNSNHFNFYATVAGQDYSNVATDNIEGTMLSLKSQKGVRYTMSFSNVEGNVYAIKDMLTGVVTEMSEGNTYEFTAPEDAVSANRFMIVGRQDAPTAIEDAEMTTSAQKGIYTIMGQYLGETNIFNTLPAGVYVVDGVKVIR